MIAESIDSVPELEALLLLREHPNRGWTTKDAGERLYVSKPVASHVLSVLAERGFAEEAGGTFRYSPASPELAAIVDALATAYSRHLIEVTHLIHSKPSASIRHFAEAFRLRKEK
ncbi:MAG TPA: hypothetical protein VEC57_19965 [Candidatus Limnocylindrales bacterium]|nr:hypothetical protein [Candidatus Limnocylindrales bacterium]